MTANEVFNKKYNLRNLYKKYIGKNNDENINENIDNNNDIEKNNDENIDNNNRLLSKLKHKIKITNGRDKIKSKRKTFSTTSISLGNNFKAFNKAYDIFDFNSLTGNTMVFEFIRRS